MYYPAMIPFEQIDDRLSAIGKDRPWLAKNTGRSENSIRVALATNASQKNRSKLLQRALTEAIESEEASQKKVPKDDPQNKIAVEFSDEDMDLIIEVSNTLGTPYREYINRSTVARARQDAKLLSDDQELGKAAS